MIIKFKLEDYYDICDEYEKVFEQADPIEVVVEDDCLITTGKRIVIPQIHRSYREAEWYWREEGSDEYEIQASVYVSYPEHEKDPAKYISFQTGELSLFAKGHCEIEGFVDIDPEELECYIDTSEFSNEQTNM